jgi:hypothetical protein
MTNLMAGYIDKAVGDAANIRTLEVVDKAAQRTVSLFTRFCDFVDMLCPESMLGRAKPKVLMIKPELMKYVVGACNGWNAYNNYLNSEQRSMVAGSFDAINMKIVESYKYTYNKWEIEGARKG